MILRKKRAKKLRNISEKNVLFNMEKEALKNTPRLYLYHQIRMSTTKIFDINQKN